MKKIFWLFLAALLAVFISAPAFADPPSHAQLADSGAITDVDLEAFLAAHRPVKAEAPADLTATVEGTYQVQVDCDLDRAVKAGKYDWVDYDFTSKDFSEPACKAGKTEVYVVSLSLAATTNKVKAELERRGLRPATRWELLALGAAQPDIRRKYGIAAFGSTWRDPMSSNVWGYPFIDDYYGGRGLSLFSSDPFEWDSNERFLAVRKSGPQATGTPAHP
jgi:hypothetical protein